MKKLASYVLFFNVAFSVALAGYAQHIENGDGELGTPCKFATDCKQPAHFCGKTTCQCYPDYIPRKLYLDDKEIFVHRCVGVIGQPCHYDTDCIFNAFCSNLTCTCKDNLYPTEDRRLCTSSAVQHKFWGALLVILLITLRIT